MSSPAVLAEPSAAGELLLPVPAFSPGPSAGEELALAAHTSLDLEEAGEAALAAIGRALPGLAGAPFYVPVPETGLLQARCTRSAWEGVPRLAADADHPVAAVYRGESPIWREGADGWEGYAALAAGDLNAGVLAVRLADTPSAAE